MTDARSRVGLRDQPIEKRNEEALGLSEYADVLTEFVQRCDTPMTIALQGDWGSGKTSLMNLIREDLREAGKRAGDAQKFLTVWFNTWQYAQFNMENTLALSMMSKFADALEEKQSDTISKLKSGLWTLTRTVAITGASFVGQSDTAKAGFDEAERRSGDGGAADPAASLERIKDGLSEAVENRMAGPTERVIVFIDDLDRLVPSRAVELLESLKLFLDIKHCVYVIACDYSVVAAGLQKKFDVSEGQFPGRSFFDKIIQVPFKMPTRRYAVDHYVGQLLGQMGLAYDSETDTDLYRRLVEHSVGFTPRTMKRLLNTLQLLTILSDKRRQTTAVDSESDEPPRRVTTRVTFAILCMMERYEAIYDHLNEGLTAKRVLTLRDGLARNDDFDELRAKIHRTGPGAESEDDSEEQNAAVDSAVKFMQAFVDCVQLDEDDNLSDEETKHLEDIMSLCSLVTVGQEVPPPVVAGRAFAFDIRGTLNRRYASFLDHYGSKFYIEYGVVYLQVTDDVQLYVSGNKEDKRYSFGVWYHEATKQTEEYCGLLCGQMGVDAPRVVNDHKCEILGIEAATSDALETFKQQLIVLLARVTKPKKNNIDSLWKRARRNS